MNEVVEAELADRDTIPGREPRSLRLVLEPPPPASALSGIALGASMGLSRLRRRATFLSLALAVALVVTGALIERVSSPAAAVTGALGGVFRLVLPLLAFGAVTETTERRRLDDAAWPVARYGVARRDAALGLVAVAALAMAIAAAALAVLSVAVAHRPADPPLVRDVFQAAWIAALTGAAYVGTFAFGATFFRRGGGKWLPLVLDFAFGASGGVVGAMLPRGNALNLLGGAAPLGLSQHASCAILMASVVALGVGAALRCRG